MKICRLSALYGERGSALPEPYRVGVYYAPKANDPLWQAGCTWLGRDAATGLNIPQPSLPDLAEHTAEPRRYGFHGTLKAPFVPRHGFESFMQAATNFAGRCKSFDMPALAVTDLRGFLALCPIGPAPQLHALADACVRALEPEREPESDIEQAKRGIGKTERQRAHIAEFGYPFIFDDFQFHMTLTGHMKNNPYFEAARAYFKAPLAQPSRVESLAIFVEDTKGSPFRLISHLPFAA